MVWKALDSQSSNLKCDRKSEDISENHQQFIEQYGWHFKYKCRTSIAELNLFPETIQTLQTSGLNLEPYNNNGKEAKKTSYTLKEKQQSGDKLSAIIYEIDGKLVGGYGVLDNWDPGIFSLDEKERLIDQGIIRSKEQ